MPVLNPTTFTITDTTAQSNGVTGLNINVGTVAGGPYTAHSYPLTAAEVSAGLPTGTFTGSLASIGEALGPGTYFAVSTATNASGTSGNSPEVNFQVQTAPVAPSAFTVS